MMRGKLLTAMISVWWEGRCTVGVETPMLTVQGSAKRLRPGCVKDSGVLRQK